MTAEEKINKISEYIDVECFDFSLTDEQMKEEMFRTPLSEVLDVMITCYRALSDIKYIIIL